MGVNKATPTISDRFVELTTDVPLCARNEIFRVTALDRREDPKFQSRKPQPSVNDECVTKGLRIKISASSSSNLASHYFSYAVCGVTSCLLETPALPAL